MEPIYKTVTLTKSEEQSYVYLEPGDLVVAYPGEVNGLDSERVYRVISYVLPTLIDDNKPTVMLEDRLNPIKTSFLLPVDYVIKTIRGSKGKGGVFDVPAMADHFQKQVDKMK